SLRKLCVLCGSLCLCGEQNANANAHTRVLSNRMRRERVLIVLSFLAIHLVWGSTYLAIRYSIETIPPLITAGLRHVIGGSALFAWCWSRGLRPTAQQWRASAILGAFFFLIGHGSLHWAEL